MKILGIDPGTARMGWGILETEPKVFAPSSGVFETKQDIPHNQRLLILHSALTEKIASEKPDVVVVERLFFNLNVQTAMAVGEGRAMVMLAAAQYEIPVFEYTALTAKLLLAGHGRAEKKLMMEAVRKILGLKELHSKIDDAADALAMALTHHYKLTGQAAAVIASGKIAVTAKKAKPAKSPKKPVKKSSKAKKI